MEPALQPEDYFILDKRAYKNQAPQRGDVVVFKVSLGPNNVVRYVKRIVGLPGEKIQMIKGTLYINDKPLPRRAVTSADDTKDQFVETLPEGKEITLQEDKESVSHPNPNNLTPTDEKGTIYNSAPEGQYFVIGDYLGHSSDSRNAVGFCR